MSLLTSTGSLVLSVIKIPGESTFLCHQILLIILDKILYSVLVSSCVVCCEQSVSSAGLYQASHMAG